MYISVRKGLNNEKKKTMVFHHHCIIDGNNMYCSKQDTGKTAEADS